MAQSLPDRTVKTIPESLIYSKWLVSSAVVIDRKVLSPIFSVPSSDSEEEFYSDVEARIKVQAHGAVKAIIDRNITGTGRVTYTVEWKDGSQSEETPRIMRRVDGGLMEAYEHQYLLKAGEEQESSDSDFVDEGQTSRSDMDTDSEPSSKEDASSASGSSSGAEGKPWTDKTNEKQQKTVERFGASNIPDCEYEAIESETSDEKFIVSQRASSRRKERETTASSFEVDVRRSTRSIQKAALDSDDEYARKPKRPSQKDVAMETDDDDERPRKQRRIRPVPKIHYHQNLDARKSSAQDKNLEAFKNTPFRRSDGVFEDIDQYSRNVMNAHWINCLRCESPGYPNGPPARLLTDKMRDSDDDGDPFVMTKAEVREMQGRLLLCLTCSAAAHESCNTSSKKSAKLRLRNQLIKGEEKKLQYQCTLCFREVEERRQKDPTALPLCIVCGKPDQRTKVTVKMTNDKPAAEDNTEVDTQPEITYQQEDENCLLFRCRRCTRTYHYDCLPDFPHVSDTLLKNIPEELRKDKSVCGKEWHCPECIIYGQPEKIMAWRSAKDPEDRSKFFDDETAKPRELLVKWKDESYRHSTWVPEAWCAAVSPTIHRYYCTKAVFTKSQSYEDAIPKSWITIDRILEAQDHHGNVIKTDSIDTVDRVLVKYASRSYEDVCWDDPPAKDSKLYPAFAIAFSKYIKGWQLKPPYKIATKIKEVRQVATAEEYRRHELRKQPDFITGGELFPHQLDGLNWLIYQWERDSPCVLADDMGLGKTVQVISFLYYLVHRFSIYPFVLVVPNSTTSNWLREFETWAPDMVVVPYHGSARALQYARDYEIFRGVHNYDQIKCHAVIMTYESVLKDKGLFHRLPYWPALIVDEGQRLKSDASSLFKKLQHLEFSHTVLMTGTPLQNNVRELMNIMHFIDPNRFKDVEDLEKKYSDLNKDLVKELHDELRPYFLRRTKELVLRGKLPPKAEIIVPVTMTPLQKEVCKDILEKNMISYAALISNDNKNNKNSKKSLSNTLMQLRKALNHPYLIDGVEMQQPNAAAIHKALIEASSKLQVLHQMLPKLKKDGHRVLIFSTMKLTLNVLEDYLAAEGYKYERIDGETAGIQRADSIDRFNAPDSDVFVFLLTTRAGGVGINLATADTVIMWDFDYNPHSDMQAAGRAYRIGQKKPVLILKFMTRYSVEEKIAQMAKKKMMLDHLIVETMEEESIEDLDVESILKFGAQALFEEDSSEDIVYDSAAVDDLLDRSQATTEQDKETDQEAEQSKQSFAFAKVWSLDKKGEELPIEESQEADQKQEDFWSNYLKQKAEQLKEMQQEKEELGRGQRRKRAPVNYYGFADEPTAKKTKKKGIAKKKGLEELVPGTSGSPESLQSDTSYVQDSAGESDKETVTEDEDFRQKPFILPAAAVTSAITQTSATVPPLSTPPLQNNQMVSTTRFQQPYVQHHMQQQQQQPKKRGRPKKAPQNNPNLPLPALNGLGHPNERPASTNTNFQQRILELPRVNTVEELARAIFQKYGVYPIIAPPAEGTQSHANMPVRLMRPIQTQNTQQPPGTRQQESASRPFIPASFPPLHPQLGTNTGIRPQGPPPSVVSNPVSLPSLSSTSTTAMYPRPIAPSTSRPALSHPPVNLSHPTATPQRPFYFYPPFPMANIPSIDTDTRPPHQSINLTRNTASKQPTGLNGPQHHSNATQQTLQQFIEQRPPAPQPPPPPALSPQGPVSQNNTNKIH